MCGADACAGSPGLPVGVAPPGGDPTEPFPWDSRRVYDAHCHPTDIMASVAEIPAMRAAALTVMATRAQDQDLVAGLLRTEEARDRIVPAFGWHPWFSYQLYDDRSRQGENAGNLTSLSDKRRHLASVLTPSPPATDLSETAAGQPGSGSGLVAALDALAASLVAVRPLSALVDETRARLQAHPTALVGEIGLDKAFRVPEPAPGESDENSSSGITPGTRDGRRLSPFRVQPAHQVAVLQAQLQLAAEMGRPVSVHGVQAHGLLYNVLAATWKGRERTVLSRRERRQVAEGAEDFDSDDDSSEDGDSEDDSASTKTKTERKAKSYPPTICLHSFSGPVDMMRPYLDPRVPATVFFSFSTAVNAASAAALERLHDVVAACPADRLLVESDLHCAGPPMDALLEDMYRRVCHIKGWTLADGVERVAQNYDDFILRKRRPRPRPQAWKKTSGRSS